MLTIAKLQNQLKCLSTEEGFLKNDIHRQIDRQSERVRRESGGREWFIPSHKQE